MAKNFLIILLSFWLVVACSSNDEKVLSVQTENNAENAFKIAQALLRSEEYERAAQAFEEIEADFPQAFWAQRAPILAAYSYYKNQDFEAARLAANRFINLNPVDGETAYAHYLVALSYFDEVNDVGRDQGVTKKALQAFERLIARFPNSNYSHDVLLKKQLAENFLAAHEMRVARYYMGQYRYHAAINRFEYVVRTYPAALHTSEALYRLTEVSALLGLKHEARFNAEILAFYFPQSHWYEKAHGLLEQIGVVLDSENAQQFKQTAKTKKHLRGILPLTISPNHVNNAEQQMPLLKRAL